MAKKIKIKKPKNLDVALQHYQSGNLQQAEMVCRQILNRQPNHSDALNLLGLIEYQIGQYDKAVYYFGRAIHISPQMYFYYNNLGLALQSKGCLDDAIENYKKALMFAPNYVAAYHNLALALATKGMIDEAIENFRKALALKPDYIEAYYNLGNALKERGMVDESIEHYQKALMLRPDYAEAYTNLGIAYKDRGMFDEAIKNLMRALELKPDFPEAYNNLGVALTDKGMTDEAIENLEKALRLNPEYADAYYNLGNAFRDKGMMDEAIENYKKALALKPDYANAYNNLGVALTDKGIIDKAIESIEKALQLNPNSTDAYNNLGNALREKCLVDEAIENYKKALALKPDYAGVYNNLGLAFADKGMVAQAIKNCKNAVVLKPDAENQKNLGMIYLFAKDFERGWEKYEWRLKGIKVAPLRKPKWDRSSLKDKIILVYAEQGYGDTLQFVRYLPKLYEDFDAKKVFFIPQKGLEQLLRESDLRAEILDSSLLFETNPSIPPLLEGGERGFSLETLEYDTNIHLLSLPRIFKTNLDNIPFRQKRYLKANPEKVKWYRERYFNNTPLPPLNRGEFKLRVGIFWQGNPALKPDRRRSMPLYHFYPICRLPEVKVYSLQKGYGIEQLNELPDGVEIISLGETFNDFSDTAAAIENLELIIAVDSAVGHLAGALGKKTWILLPSHAEWRWHLDMDYSPWYEDVRLFRHKEYGKKDWDEMMERVKEQVEAEVKNR